MKKRLLSLLIVGVMTVALLSGGGASEDTQDQSGSVAQPDQSSDEASYIKYRIDKIGKEIIMFI